MSEIGGGKLRSLKSNVVDDGRTADNRAYNDEPESPYVVDLLGNEHGGGSSLEIYTYEVP